MILKRQITDFDIQALVDDELDGEDARRVEDHLKLNRKAERRYHELLQQKQLLQN